MDTQIEYIEQFLTGKMKFRKTRKEDYNYKYYCQQENELQKNKQYTYKDLADKINKSILKEKYVKYMREFNTDILYKSYIHGLNHNIRVSIFALIISILEEVNGIDFKILLDSAKYHDIGRCNDLEDNSHGLEGSKMIDFLNNSYSLEDFNVLKTIIISHSMNDNMFDEIAMRNDIVDIERCRKLFKILKDADGLDRVRLEYPYIETEFLRNECSTKLILFAYDLVNNYNDYFGGKNDN